MRYLGSILASGFLFFSLAPVWADAPKHQPAVSFSPAVVDFGLVPSNTKCTQLVTVMFDRHVFSPEHLPTLQPDRNSQADVSLFARFDGPDFIRAVYRVTIDAFFQIGPFQNHLILVDDARPSPLYPPGPLADLAGINVIGESVQGLEAPTQPVNFGDVKVGAARTKSVTIGFYAPPMVSLASRGKPGQVLFPHAPGLFPGSAGLKGVFATSTSPDFTAQELTGLRAGVNASTWEVWTVTFKSHLPLGRMNAELQFQTQDGYCATVPVTAEVVGPIKPEPHTPKKH